MPDDEDDIPSTVCIEVMEAVVERIPWRLGFLQLALLVAALVATVVYLSDRPPPAHAGRKVAPEAARRPGAP